MTKLTNDVLTLLQDPENRKIVNDGQDEFGVGTMVGYRQGQLAFKLNDETVPFCFDDLSGANKLSILRWCIKLLPAFQVEIDEYNEIMESHATLYSVVKRMAELHIPKTLSEALLKCGAMTTEELETEYERLMK
jgi:hypothetical protein